MKTRGNTVLITGGATGIGLALAEAFMRAGNQVLICGRRRIRLEEARKKLPGLQIRQCDVTLKRNRKELYDWVIKEHPDLNILINNAGIQRFIDFTRVTSGLSGGENEVKTNLMAPIQLSASFAPLLMKQNEAAIMNVTSGLGFVPIAAMPVYCATKAGLHSFCVSLRHQLKDTPVKVFEIIPPAVETGLGKVDGTANESEYPGIKPSVVARAVIAAFKQNEYEIAIGEAKGLVEGSQKDFEKTFTELNSW